jgi:hypothetical protein
MENLRLKNKKLYIDINDKLKLHNLDKHISNYKIQLDAINHNTNDIVSLKDAYTKLQSILNNVHIYDQSIIFESAEDYSDTAPETPPPAPAVAPIAPIAPIAPGPPAPAPIVAPIVAPGPPAPAPIVAPIAPGPPVLVLVPAPAPAPAPVAVPGPVSVAVPGPPGPPGPPPQGPPKNTPPHPGPAALSAAKLKLRKPLGPSGPPAALSAAKLNLRKTLGPSGLPPAPPGLPPAPPGLPPAGPPAALLIKQEDEAVINLKKKQDNALINLKQTHKTILNKAMAAAQNLSMKQRKKQLIPKQLTDNYNNAKSKMEATHLTDIKQLYKAQKINNPTRIIPDEYKTGGGNRSESPYIDYNTDDKNTTGLLMVGGTMLSEYWKQITIVLCILALLYIIYLIYTENKKYSEYINYQAEYNPYNNSCTSIF